jgi:hypothetical protein
LDRDQEDSEVLERYFLSERGSFAEVLVVAVSLHDE